MNSAEFSPEGSPAGQRILTASKDGSVRLWRYRWDDLVDALNDSTRLCMTKVQRKDYLGESEEDAESRVSDCEKDKSSASGKQEG